MRGHNCLVEADLGFGARLYDYCARFVAENTIAEKLVSIDEAAWVGSLLASGCVAEGLQLGGIKGLAGHVSSSLILESALVR